MDDNLIGTMLVTLIQRMGGRVTFTTEELNNGEYVKLEIVVNRVTGEVVATAEAVKNPFLEFISNKLFKGREN